MAAPVTVDEFLELIRKSNVTEGKRLDAYLAKLRAAQNVPVKATVLAGFMVRDGLLTHFQAEQLMQGKWRRFTIGKYKVLERLGSGGMGSVFLCEHKLMRRRVAVKVLPTARANDPASLDRFYREARAVAALDHPNIVHAYDIDQDEQLHFIVMEYVDGTSLQDLIKKVGPLDVSRACHYIRQAALGLEHAHEAGLVHRDIKPGNILVDRTGLVKLLDMGLARFFNDEDDILTKKYDESVLGTADYLAPEQAIDSHSVDIRADIYGLGATFYYLLAGRPPFGEGTIAQKLLWHQTRNPRPLSEYRQDVPAELAAVLGKMMAKEPSQRYSVPGELDAALAPFTRTPIAPPSDAEMPRLSVAATGEVPESAAGRAAPGSAGSARAPQGTGSSAGGVAIPGMGSSASQQSGPAPRSAPASPPVRGPGSSASAARPAALRKQAPSRPALAPAPDPSPSAEDMASWEALAADTANPAGAADTSPVRHSSRHLTRAKADRREKRRLKLVVAAVGIPFLIVLVVLLWRFYPRSATVPPTGRAKLLVTRDAGKANTYRTIQLALRQAQMGDIIELLDDELKENVTVEVGPGKASADITLQAAAGVNVHWLAARKDEPLLKLTRAAGFRLKGQGITLDGEKKVRDLITISLQSPGLTLDDAILQGYSRSAIAIVNGAGEAGKPIRLRRLNVLGAGAGRPALFLDANPAVESVPFDDYIEVTDLHVEGLDLGRAVQKKDNTVTGNNLVLPGAND
jgi:eukaryotic-like serine/threonine-protein kinase